MTQLSALGLLESSGRLRQDWQNALHFGRIDVLVNNAGYGPLGAVEEITDPEARSIFDTNAFGLLNVTRAALPMLRSQKAGRIINIGSSAGFASSAGRGLYSASKSARCSPSATSRLHDGDMDAQRV